MHFEQRRERDSAASGGIDASKTVDLHGGKKVRAESGDFMIEYGPSCEVLDSYFGPVPMRSKG